MAKSDYEKALVYYCGSNMFDCVDSHFIQKSEINPQNNHVIVSSTDPDDTDENGCLTLYNVHVWCIDTSANTLSNAEHELRNAIDSHPWSANLGEQFKTAFCSACLFLAQKNSLDSEESDDEEHTGTLSISPPAKVPRRVRKTKTVVKQAASVIASADNDHCITEPVSCSPLKLDMGSLTTLEVTSIREMIESFRQTGQIPPPIVPEQNDKSAVLEKLEKMEKIFVDQVKSLQTGLTRVENKLNLVIKSLKTTGNSDFSNGASRGSLAARKRSLAPQLQASSSSREDISVESPASLISGAMQIDDFPGKVSLTSDRA